MPVEPIVELFPLTSDGDADMVVSFANRAFEKLLPRHLDWAVDEFRVRYNDPLRDVRFFGMLDEHDEIHGLGITYHWIDGVNEHLQFVQIYVRPESRSMGRARGLLAHAWSIATDAGRSVILADTYDTVPSGEAFALAVGANVGMTERISVIGTKAVDRAMLHAWRQSGPDRAEGYEVLQWTDGYPEEHDAQIARLFVIADEDMPFEDAAFDPSAETAETVRARLERTESTVKRITSIARHVESGELAGFSELTVRPSNPNALSTSLTVVHRDHRGHALGKWIKADSILRAMERWPDATHVQTENAASNAPMLGINDAIGFRLEHTLIAYQATVEQVRAYLDRT